MYIIDNVFDDKTVKTILNVLHKTSQWVEGKNTSGFAAAQVKINQQIDINSLVYKEIYDIANNSLQTNDKFLQLTLPKYIHSLLFSKTESGGRYGKHSDAAFMMNKRTDLSFTVFLNEPDEYEGGYLSTEQYGNVKLKSGSAFVYPSSMVHQVTEVTSGTRYVCCGWIESRLKDHEKRDLLYNLEQVRKNLLETEGKSENFDILNNCHNNLIRMWFE